MSRTTACAGCEKTIIVHSHSPIFLDGEIVGYVHKIPVISPVKRAPDCIMRAYWGLRLKHPEMTTIVVEGKKYNETNVLPLGTRRGSGSSISAISHVHSQKSEAGITHSLPHPNHSH